MGMENWQTVARDQKEWRRLVLQAKVYNRLQCLGRRRKKVKNRVPLSTP